MISKAIKCIHCESKDIVKNGKHKNDKQCLKCKTCNKIFQEEYKNHGAKPQTKLLIVKISLNGSGIRDISRVLNISQNTVLSTLKKQKNIKQT
jgi:transposase-like protein